MHASTYPQDTESVATLTEDLLIWCHERIFSLEQELESARSRISQQQEKLNRLGTVLGYSHASPENGLTAPAARSLSEAEIGHPGYPYRKVVAQAELATA